MTCPEVDHSDNKDGTDRHNYTPREIEPRRPHRETWTCPLPLNKTNSNKSLQQTGPAQWRPVGSSAPPEVRGCAIARLCNVGMHVS